MIFCLKSIRKSFLFTIFKNSNISNLMAYRNMEKLLGNDIILSTTLIYNFFHIKMTFTHVMMDKFRICS